MGLPHSSAPKSTGHGAGLEPAKSCSCLAKGQDWALGSGVSTGGAAFPFPLRAAALDSLPAPAGKEEGAWMPPVLPILRVPGWEMPLPHGGPQAGASL